MSGTVDFSLAIKQLLLIAHKHGHHMYHVGVIKFTHSKETEHIKGIGGGDLWGCHCNPDGCRAVIWTMCSDGTVDSLGPQSTIHQVLNTPEVEYGCGVKPGVMTKPEHFHPGTTTKH